MSSIFERVGADETVAKRLKCALDRLRPSFEAGLAPADRAVLALDPDEHPARRRWTRPLRPSQDRAILLRKSPREHKRRTEIVAPLKLYWAVGIAHGF